MNIFIGIMLVIVVLVVSFVLFGQLVSDARIRNLERDYSNLKQTLTNLEISQVDQCSNVFKRLDDLEADISLLQAFRKSKKKNRRDEN